MKPRKDGDFHGRTVSLPEAIQLRLPVQTMFQGHHVRHFLANHNARGLCISCSCEYKASMKWTRVRFKSDNMLQIYRKHVQNWLKTETGNKNKTESHKNQTYYEATQPTQLTKFNRLTKTT